MASTVTINPGMFPQINSGGGIDWDSIANLIKGGSQANETGLLTDAELQQVKDLLGEQATNQMNVDANRINAQGGWENAIANTTGAWQAKGMTDTATVQGEANKAVADTQAKGQIEATKEQGASNERVANIGVQGNLAGLDKQIEGQSRVQKEAGDITSRLSSQESGQRINEGREATVETMKLKRNDREASGNLYSKNSWSG